MWESVKTALNNATKVTCGYFIIWQKWAHDKNTTMYKNIQRGIDTIHVYNYFFIFNLCPDLVRPGHVY